MSKYHITKSGKVAKCRATKKPCPLGTHYDNKKEAEIVIQKQLSDEFGMLSDVIEDKEKQLEKRYNNQYELVKRGKFKNRKDEEFERTRLANISNRINGNQSEVENLRDLLKDLREPNAGVNMSVSTNNKQKVIMAITGFCANPYPEHSKVFDNVKEINHSSILEFMDNVDQENEDILSHKDIYVGLWNDPKSNKIHLDVSKRYNSAKDARVVSESNGKTTYFDLQTNEAVIIKKR